LISAAVPWWITGRGGGFDFIQTFALFIAYVGKSRGVGRGGKRPGAGRPRGRRDKRAVLMELLPKLEAADRPLPLYRLLDRIADEALDAKYRDALCVQVLPFMHSRLIPNLSAKPFYLMSDEELREVEAAELEHEKQLRKGRGHLHLIKEPR
jgi:hypothetical protein